MDVFFITLQQIFVLFSIIAIGFFAIRRKKLDSSAIGVLTYVYSNIMLPCAIVKAMIFDFTLSILKECMYIIGISVFVIAFELLISFLFNKITRQPKLDQNLYKYCILFSNFGIMGIPIIETVFGSEGLFYMSVFILILRIMINSYGFMLLQKDTPYSTGINIAMFKNKFIIAMIIGVLVSILNINIPSPIQSLIDTLSRANAPIGMMIVGMNIAEYPVIEMFKNKLAWIIVVLRLLVIPIFGLLVLWHFHININAVLAAVTTLGLPCPAYASILSKKYGGNYVRGSQIVVTSTLFSAITIPFLVWLCNFVYGL